MKKRSKQNFGGLYSHPERTIEGNSLILDENNYQVITYFVEQIELITPEVIEDLKEIYNTYDKAYQWFKAHNETKLSPDEWSIVKKASTHYCPAYVELKHKISDWAVKYNLLGEYDYYQGLGLESLASYHEDCQETNRQERIVLYEFIAKTRNEPIEEIRRYKHFNDLWPYEEKLGLAKHIYKEDSSDNIELSKYMGLGGEIHSSFFEQTFPFTFTPSNSGPFKYGFAWDPRTELWQDFEESLDKMYANHKKIYQERAIHFLKKNGYSKKGQKRNSDHLIWLVHSRIQGWSNSKIADHYNEKKEILSDDTISHGVKSATKLVLLEPMRKKTFKNDKQIEL